MVKNVMAVGAHPDDVEVGCFGTLLHHIDEGDNIIVVITTKGGYSDRHWDIIQSEYQCSEKLLGLEYILLDNPIAYYEFNRSTVKEMDSIIQQNSIDTIYCNWYGDFHQDHQAVFKNVLTASRKTEIKNLYCYELGSYSYRMHLIFKPQLFVNITKYFKQKICAINCYKSYFKNHKLLEAIELLARLRGINIGVKYAESFEIIFETRC